MAGVIHALIGVDPIQSDLIPPYNATDANAEFQKERRERDREVDGWRVKMRMRMRMIILPIPTSISRASTCTTIGFVPGPPLLLRSVEWLTARYTRVPRGSTRPPAIETVHLPLSTTR